MQSERSQNANKQNSQGCGPAEAWYQALWATFSRETSQTQQTPNNYPLEYTQAWNHTNSLSQEPELWVQFGDDCCHCGPMMVSLVMYLSVLFYHNERLKLEEIILRMICTAVIASSCFVLCVFVINSWSIWPKIAFNCIQSEIRSRFGCVDKQNYRSG